MAYNKHTWTTGETITAEKLNNIEGGVFNAGGFFIVGFSDEERNYLDKTWEEIRDAILSGKMPVIIEIDDNGDAETTAMFSEFLTSTAFYGQTEGGSIVTHYTIGVYNDNTYHYECLSPSDYPVYTED